jgi:hypothetical protein
MCPRRYRQGLRRMIASEAAYFDGNHCAHVAARDEARRLERIQAENRKLARLMSRSPLRSSAPQRDAGELALFVAGNEPRLF